MTRKKVKLAFITNDSSRKATFKKRKKGLMKKISELSTLCGVDACAVVYSPYESQPSVWPEDGSSALRVVAQFKRMPEMEQSKKMINQESFIGHRVSKADEQLKKLRRDNREKEVTDLMYRCLIGKSGLHELGQVDLSDLGWIIDRKMEEIYKRIEACKKTEPVVEEKAAPVVPVVVERQQQQQQWFGEWMGINNVNTSDYDVDQAQLTSNDHHHPHNAGMWSNAFFP